MFPQMKAGFFTPVCVLKLVFSNWLPLRWKVIALVGYICLLFLRILIIALVSFVFCFLESKLSKKRSQSEIKGALSDRKQERGQNCKMYLSKLQNVFVQIAKCFCPNFKMYLSKLQNVHIQMQNICVQMAKCVCPKTGRANNMFETNQLCFLWSEHLSVKAFSYAPLYIWDIETQIWLIQFLPPYKLIKEGLKVYHIQKREIYLDLGCNILSNVFNNV